MCWRVWGSMGGAGRKTGAHRGTARMEGRGAEVVAGSGTVPAAESAADRSVSQGEDGAVVTRLALLLGGPGKERELEAIQRREEGEH